MELDGIDAVVDHSDAFGREPKADNLPASEAGDRDKGTGGAEGLPGGNANG